MSGVGPIVSPTAVNKFGVDFERNVVGAGPFQLEKYVPDQELTFKRFEGFFGKDASGNRLPYLNRAQIKFVNDPTVAVAALQSGDVDEDSRISPQVVDRIKSSQDITLVTLKSWQFLNIQTFITRPPLDNINIRKAISYAIDRDEIVKSIFNGLATPATGITAPGWWWFDKTIEGHRYDPAKAKEYLAMAGVPNGLAIKAGAYRLGPSADVATAVQGMLKRVGIDMSLDIIEVVAFHKNFRTEGQFDMGFQVGGNAIDPDSLRANHASDGFYNPGNAKVPAAIDQLFEQGVQSYDFEERKKIYQRLERELIDWCQTIPTVNADSFLAHRNAIKNFRPGPAGIGDMRWVWRDA